MKKTTVVLCYLAIVAAVVWSILAVGNGKVANFFGNELFMASADDMYVAFALNIVSAICLAILAVIRYATRKRA